MSYEPNTKIETFESYPILYNGDIFHNMQEIKYKYPFTWPYIALEIERSGTTIINL